MNLYEESIRIIKKNQTETGAYVASPSFSQYGFCWLRDSSFIAEAMAEAGEYESAGRYFRWVENVLVKNKEAISRTLQKDRSDITLQDFLPTRYTLTGERNNDNWENAQSDGYGTYLWALGKFVEKTDYKINREMVELVCRYLEKVWKHPCYDAWEEEKDALHTSTLISIAAGLKAGAKMLDRETAWKEIKCFIEEECVTEGRLRKSTLNSGVDSSLIWGVCPYKLWEVQTPLVRNTISKIEEDLFFEGGLKRYCEDSYFGGGSWILLSASLALYYQETGQEEKVGLIERWIESQADAEMNLPEQVSEHLLFDDYYEEWLNKWGKIANPLLWSHANYIKLRPYGSN
ncbi:MAG TPA: glycoside hydrolase family 15 protein [Thermotogota bacterium]|nr:glycoside hydrolase family 15 protein [Thermotogota bacterium]